MHFGYALSSEEHTPLALIDHAVAAEAAGFEFALVSDSFHPWIDKQGESPFVWTSSEQSLRARVRSGSERE